MTEDELRRLREELRELESAGRSRIAAQIKTAREWGDLKENAEYHIAKEDQALLETKILRLRTRLSAAVIVEPNADGAKLSFGRTAEVFDETSGATHTWTIVGATEANIAEGRLSSESPVAKALLERAVGESASVETPSGVRTYRVQRLVS